MPLPEHEVNKEFIGELVKILMEELEIERHCFGSTTFKRKDMAQGIEPDQCLYSQNYDRMIGKKRIDLTPKDKSGGEPRLAAASGDTCRESSKLMVLNCFQSLQLVRYVTTNAPYSYFTKLMVLNCFQSLQLVRYVTTNAPYFFYSYFTCDQKFSIAHFSRR